MKWRSHLAALGLYLYAVVHAGSTLSWYRAGLPASLWLALGFQSLGCAGAAYGLFRGRDWARLLGLAIGVICILQISVTGVLAWRFDDGLRQSISIQSGVIQWLACAAMVVCLSGATMRSSYEERTWDLNHRLARLLRITVIFSIGSIAMLFFMAANAVYATEVWPRYLAASAALLLILSHLMVARRYGVALLLLSVASIAGLVASIATIVCLDTNPALAGQVHYWSRTVVAGIAAMPGLVACLVLFLAVTPRFVRMLRGF
jgi:hypothetical protein